MAVYMISRMKIENREEYDAYAGQFMEVFSKTQGKILSVDDEPEVLAGDWNFTRSVLIEFPSREQLFGWLASPDYQEIASHRIAAGTAETILVKGLEELPTNP